MNLPDWSWLPNPDNRHLLQFLWREALLWRMPFLAVIPEPDVPAGIPNESLVVIEGQEKDDNVLERFLRQNNYSCILGDAR